MEIKHYLYNKNWSNKEVKRIKETFDELGSCFDQKAAIGLGAGGIEIEAIIEVLIEGLVVNAAYDVIRTIITKLFFTKPKKKTLFIKTPYEVYFHINGKDITFNLNCKEGDLYNALNLLEQRLKQEKEFSRLGQNEGVWTEI